MALCLEGKIRVIFTHAENPVGRGQNQKRNALITNVRTFVKHSKSVIAVQNTDQLCLPKALVIGEGETLVSDKRNGTSKVTMADR